jgi:hypothetical protein
MGAAISSIAARVLSTEDAARLLEVAPGPRLGTKRRGLEEESDAETCEPVISAYQEMT